MREFSWVIRKFLGRANKKEVVDFPLLRMI